MGYNHEPGGYIKWMISKRLTQQFKMADVLTLLLALALASQKCFAQQQSLGGASMVQGGASMLQEEATASEDEGAEARLLPNTLVHIHGVEQALNYPPTAPVMTVLIQGMYSLLDDTEAENAFEETLDRMLSFARNKQLLELSAYVLESLNVALENPEVREVIKKKLAITNEVFTKNEVKTFVTQGIQTSYRVLTDDGILKPVRQCIRAAAKVLTNQLCQQRIAKALKSLTVILKDPEALGYVENTLKAVNRILSSKQAQNVISTTVQTLTKTAGALSENNAKRIGKMQSRLAKPSGLPSLGLPGLTFNYL